METIDSKTLNESGKNGKMLAGQTASSTRGQRRKLVRTHKGCGSGFRRFKEWSCTEVTKIKRFVSR